MTRISYGTDTRHAANAFDVLACQTYGVECVARGLRDWWRLAENRLPNVPPPNQERIVKALHVAILRVSAQELNEALAQGGLDVYWPAQDGYLD